MLGYCGINCHECAGYRGTVNTDKALLDNGARTKLGAPLATRLQDMLDARTRAIICASGELGTHWYSASGWEERSEKLFAAAGDVAKALGK